jgi:hypothetical protein
MNSKSLIKQFYSIIKAQTPTLTAIKKSDFKQLAAIATKPKN